MNLAERAFGGCRIYAAAVAAPRSQGFHAAVVVKAAGSGPGAQAELFRDECLHGGRVWMDPAAALAFALDAGQAAVVAQRGWQAHLAGATHPAGAPHPAQPVEA